MFLFVVMVYIKKNSMNLTKIKEGFKFLITKLFWKNVLLALAIFVVLVFGLLIWLRFYTHHGEFVVVPDLKDLKMEQVVPILEERHLRYEVIDSTYNPSLAPGAVVEQSPVASERIKTNRTIYLTINSLNKPLISIPDVTDMSQRNAQATLESLGFHIVGIEEVFSEYRGLVAGVKTPAGQNAIAGSKLPVGANLILVVGSNTVEDTSFVDTSLVDDNAVNSSSDGGESKRPRHHSASSDEEFVF